MNQQLHLKCAKCGRQDEWVEHEDGIGDLCINCEEKLDIWLVAHPYEPVQNFIHPKPWPMPPMAITPVERLLWSIFGPGHIVIDECI